MAGPNDFFSPGEWSNPLNDPRLRAGLLQTGLQLMTQRGWGQGAGDAIAGALGTGAEAVGRGVELDRKDLADAQRQQEVDSKGELRASQADAATSRSQTAGALADVKRGQLDIAQQGMDLKRDQFNAASELNNRKYDAMMAIAQSKLQMAKDVNERKVAQDEVNRIAKEAHTANEILRTHFMGQRTDLIAGTEANKNNRTDLNNSVRLSNLYQNYRKTVEAANAKIDGSYTMSDAEKATKRQSVLPMADWIETQPNLKTVYGRSVREPGGQVDVNGPVSPQDPTMTVSPRQVQDPGPAPTTPSAGPQVEPTLPPKNQLQTGKVYPTSRGPMKWTGTGFVQP